MTHDAVALRDRLLSSSRIETQPAANTAESLRLEGDIFYAPPIYGINASDITLTGAARGFNFATRARLVPADPIELEITKFDAMRGRDRISLANSATIVMRNSGADLRNLALRLGTGRLTIAGHVGSKLNLKVGARAVPLATANIFAPKLGLSGRLDGVMTLVGPHAAPSGAYRFKIVQLAAAQTRALGSPLIDVDATRRFEGSRTTMDATLAAGRANMLKISGSTPLGAKGMLDLAVKGDLDANLLTRSMTASGSCFTGLIAVDGRLSGTVQQPNASGSITLSNGSFQDANFGTRLEAVHARLVAHGDKATLESASATTRNGGSITADGSFRIDPASGFPGTIHIKGQKAEVMHGSPTSAIVGLDLDISGPLARYPHLGGSVDIDSLDIAIPDRLQGPRSPCPERATWTRPRQPPPGSPLRPKTGDIRARRRSTLRWT